MIPSRRVLIRRRWRDAWPVSDSLAHGTQLVGAEPAAVVGVAAPGFLLCTFVLDLMFCAFREKDSDSVPLLPFHVPILGLVRCNAHTMGLMLNACSHIRSLGLQRPFQTLFQVWMGTLHRGQREHHPAHSRRVLEQNQSSQSQDLGLLKENLDLTFHARNWAPSKGSRALPTRWLLFFLMAKSFKPTSHDR